MLISVIIRTKNEEQFIGKVLSGLENQTFQDFEIVIIDSGSQDNTLNLVKSFAHKLNIKIISIQPEEFTYPRACNIGAKSSHGKYLCFLSGHSIPKSNIFFEYGMTNFSKYNKVAGIYGPVLPLPNASWTEKIYYSFGYLHRSVKIIAKLRMGILGNTNSLILRDLWQKHPFDEKYSKGGEDYQWAKYYLRKGYIFVKDPHFTVYHSHNLNFIKFLGQWLMWKRSSI